MNETFVDIIKSKYEKLGIAYIENRLNRILAGFVPTGCEINRDILLTMSLHTLGNDEILTEEQTNNVINLLNNSNNG